MRALISVWDKTGLDEFARGLAGLGVELVTTGGSTHAYLVELGLEPTLVDVPQVVGGRVRQRVTDEQEDASWPWASSGRA